MSRHRLAAAVLVAGMLAAAAPAAEVKLLLPQGRTAFQTNEWVDVSVVRGGATEGELKLTLAGADGSKVETTFPAARAVEHLHVNGWLLRPGKYAVTVSVDGTTASADIELFSHLRQSNFRLIN